MCRFNIGHMHDYCVCCLFFLTYTIQFCIIHRGRVTHICVSKLTIMGSVNGLAPTRWRQAIISTNVGILLIGSQGTNFNDYLIAIHSFHSRKSIRKTSSEKWQPFCLGLNVTTLVSVALPFLVMPHEIIHTHIDVHFTVVTILMA